VTDQNANQIQRFNSSLAAPFIIPLTVGAALGDISSPRGIAVDSDGNLIVCDASNSRVEKFSTVGAFLGIIGTKGPGTSPGEFYLPNFVTVDGNRNVYVSDFDNQTVLKFAPF
jgi:DNA-binding beta-propeller fold protein YncE